MTEHQRLNQLLEGLARLSEKTGFALSFGVPGSESRLVVVDEEGEERFEIANLKPKWQAADSEVDYEALVTGTMSFSSNSSGNGASDESKPQEAQELPVSEHVSKPGASVVRVDRRFGIRRSGRELRSDSSAQPQIASGE
jgi:hypothetical protein